MKRSLITGVLMLFVLMASLSACSKKTCSTKHKTKVPMGFM